MMSAFWKRLRPALLAALFAASFIGPAHAAITTDGATFRDPGSGTVTSSTVIVPSAVTLTSLSTYYAVANTGSLTGTYQLSASVVANVVAGDNVACVLGPSSASAVGAYANQIATSPGAYVDLNFLPITETLSGVTVYLNCEDTTSAGKTILGASSGAYTYLTVLKMG